MESRRYADCAEYEDNDTEGMLIGYNLLADNAWEFTFAHIRRDAKLIHVSNAPDGIARLFAKATTWLISKWYRHELKRAKARQYVYLKSAKERTARFFIESKRWFPLPIPEDGGQ